MIKLRRFIESGYIVCIWDTRNTYNILVQKSHVMSPIWKHKYRQEDGN